MNTEQDKYVDSDQGKKSRFNRAFVAVWLLGSIQMMLLQMVSEGVYQIHEMIFVSIVFYAVNATLIDYALKHIHKLKVMHQTGKNITFPKTQQDFQDVMVSLSAIFIPIALFPFELLTMYFKTHQKGSFDATTGDLLMGLIEASLMTLICVALFAMFYTVYDKVEQFIARLKNDFESDPYDADSMVSISDDWDGLRKAEKVGFFVRPVCESLERLRTSGIEQQMPEADVVLINQQLIALDAIMNSFLRLQSNSRSRVEGTINEFLNNMNQHAQKFIIAEDEVNINKINRKAERMKRAIEDAV